MSAVFSENLIMAILTGALLDTTLTDDEAKILVPKSETGGRDPGEYAVQIDATEDPEFFVLRRTKIEPEERDKVMGVGDEPS